MVPSQGLIPVDVHYLNEMHKMYNYDMAWVNVINKLKMIIFLGACKGFLGDFNIVFGWFLYKFLGNCKLKKS